MAKLIGGISIKQLCELCNISRSGLYNYKKDPHWPGDDAPLEYIKAFIVSKRPANRSGRKKTVDTASTPTSPTQNNSAGAGDYAGSLDDELDDEFNNLQNMLNLDDELKRTVIEKNKAQVAKYQQACLQEYRDRLHRKIGKAFALIIAELREMDLTRAQLMNVKRAFERAHAELSERQADVENDQPELEFGECVEVVLNDESDNTEVTDE